MFTGLRVFASRVFEFFSPRRASSDDRDFAQELDTHLALLTDENIRRGMAPTEAARAAHIQLGGVAQLRETIATFAACLSSTLCSKTFASPSACC